MKKMERPPMERALYTHVVLDIIMSHLNVTDLLDCRKVSKFWNKAASSILRRRSTMIKTISKKRTLKELEECLKQSSDFPFAGLIFDKPRRLQSAGGMRFFENYGARFTRFCLNTRWTRLQDLAPFINRLPRLSILEMGRYNFVPPPAESSDSAAGQEDCKILNLPSLRTLRIYSGLSEDVFREICTATSPSVRIECLRTSYGTLKALKNSGKLQAVSVVEVRRYWCQRRKKLRVDELLSTDTPALTKLYFGDNGCISRKGLMKLLMSSQHTLKELSLVAVCPSELLSECPVLAKLTTLTVSLGKSYEYFFQGSHGHKFPALTELKLCAGFEFPISDGLFIIPTVTSIDLEGYVKKDIMKQLAQTFPNVDTIGLEYEFYSGLVEDFKTGESILSEIWSVQEFKQLKKLRIREFVVEQSNKNYVNMDVVQGSILLTVYRSPRHPPKRAVQFESSGGIANP